MPWLSQGFLVLRDKAIESVSPILEPYGEFLPLLSDEARLVGFRPTLRIHAQDEQNSEIVRFSTGRIMRLKRGVLTADSTTGKKIFGLSQMHRGAIYLTEEIVLEIEQTGSATGTSFVPADVRAARP